MKIWAEKSQRFHGKKCYDDQESFNGLQRKEVPVCVKRVCPERGCRSKRDRFHGKFGAPSIGSVQDRSGEIPEARVAKVPKIEALRVVVGLSERRIDV